MTKLEEARNAYIAAGGSKAFSMSHERICREICREEIALALSLGASSTNCAACELKDNVIHSQDLHIKQMLGREKDHEAKIANLNDAWMEANRNVKALEEERTKLYKQIGELADAIKGILSVQQT